jgi:hypothetical protein
MQRSGTSALSGALHALGVSFGQAEMLYEADSNNPQGYFEHRRATVFNLRCLHTFQMHPTCFDRLPPDWKEHPGAKELRDELKAFLKDEFAGCEHWAIKQPLASLLLPIYLSVFEELGIRAQFLVCVRNPLETLRSEAKLEFGDSYRVMASLGMRAIGSWLRYTLGSLADLQGQDVSVVCYDDLVRTPLSVLERVAGGWADLEELLGAAGSIRADLRHHRTSPEELRELPDLVSRSFECVSRFDSGDSEKWGKVLALHQEFEWWRGCMGEPAPPRIKLGLGWIDGSQRVAEASYVPSGGWQKVSVEIDAPPKAALNGLLSPFPCRVWIRQSVWRVGERTVPAEIKGGLASRVLFENGMVRLDAVYEAGQINLRTPGGPGPYRLEIEFLLERGVQVSEEISANLARHLEVFLASGASVRKSSL